LTLHVGCVGPESGERIWFFAGGQAYYSAFSGIWDIFAQKEFRICTCYRYGLGFSDVWNFPQPLSHGEQLRSQEEVLRKIGWSGEGKRPFHVIGYSYGGLMAVDFVHKYTNFSSQVSRLILTDPLLYWDNPDFIDSLLTPFVNQVTFGKLLIDSGIIPLFWRIGLLAPSLPFFKLNAADEKIVGYLSSTTILTGSLAELEMMSTVVCDKDMVNFKEILNRKNVKVFAMVTSRFFEGQSSEATHTMWKKEP